MWAAPVPWTPDRLGLSDEEGALRAERAVRAHDLGRLSVSQNATAAAVAVGAATALPHPNRGASEPTTVTLAPAADDLEQRLSRQR
jgi:hypothetical protein